MEYSNDYKHQLMIPETSRFCSRDHFQGRTTTKYNNTLDENHNGSNSISNKIFYLFNFLSYTMQLFKRYVSYRSPVSRSNRLDRFYQGMVFICLICAIEAQTSTSNIVQSSISNNETANSTNTSTSYHSVLSSPIVNNSFTYMEMTSSVYSATSSVMHSVNTSVAPSPTLALPMNYTSSLTTNKSSSDHDVTVMTSSYDPEYVTSMSSSIGSSIYHEIASSSSSLTSSSSSSSNVSYTAHASTSSPVLLKSSPAVVSSSVLLGNSSVMAPTPMVSTTMFMNSTVTPIKPDYSVNTSIAEASIPILTPLMNSSTDYLNASMSQSSTISTSVVSSPIVSLINSTSIVTSVQSTVNQVDLSSSPIVETLSTSYMNGSSATIQIKPTTPNATIFGSGTQSMIHINATPASSVLPSTTEIILNESSIVTILPSSSWTSTSLMNSSTTSWNISSMVSNLSMTSSFNQTTSLISPNSTVLMMMSSSLSMLPTPSPDLGIRRCSVNVRIVNEQFSTELNEKNSTAYKTLESKVKNAFEDMFSPLPGFIDVTVIGFSNGSVFVNMKANFNTSSNVTTAEIRDTIMNHNATNNTQNFIFSQALSVKDECTPGFCFNKGSCQSNTTVGAFCKCPAGFTGTRCDKVIVNGSYSSWSDYSECSKSCKGGKMHRSRTCTNPPPQNGGRDCSSLGPNSEEKDCNSDVLCPVIWAIIGICCALFIILLILLIICCLRRKKKQKEESSASTKSSQMNIVPLEIMVYDDGLPTARRSPDGTSNPEFVNESETEEDDIYKKQLLLFLKQSHLIKPGMNLSFGDDISETSDYSNANSRKASTMSIENDARQNGKPQLTSEL